VNLVENALELEWDEDFPVDEDAEPGLLDWGYRAVAISLAFSNDALFSSSLPDAIEKCRHYLIATGLRQDVDDDSKIARLASRQLPTAARNPFSTIRPATGDGSALSV